ncbi:MAG: VCBS repeat-containing protein, partial [Planctomycetota bacterium]
MSFTTSATVQRLHARLRGFDCLALAVSLYICCTATAVPQQGSQAGPSEIGACCFAGSCLDVSEQDCAIFDGLFLGAGFLCQPGSCPEPVGACCAISGDCWLSTDEECNSTGGLYQGIDVMCAPSLTCCTFVATGACCLDGTTCNPIGTEEFCVANGGIYFGDGTFCSDFPCDAIGACCLSDLTCAEVSRYDCAIIGGFFGGNDTMCDADAIIFVDDDAPPGGDGTSWATAFDSLQDAISMFSGCTSEIRIAGGRYLPDDGISVTPGDRTVSFDFSMPTTMSVFGGFAGLNPVGGDAADTRNTTQYISVLSGDLIGDDLPGFQNRADNSVHVVIGGLVLDGLVIEGGNANDTTSDDGQRGGGVLLDGTGTTMRDCTVQSNESMTEGGGVAGSRHVSIDDCRFFDNRTSGHGGAVSLVRSSDVPPMLITHSQFSENHADTSGGALYLGFLAGLSESEFGACTSAAGVSVVSSDFILNTASTGGGIANRSGSLVLDSVVWLNNTATYGDALATLPTELLHPSYVTMNACTVSVDEAVRIAGDSDVLLIGPGGVLGGGTIEHRGTIAPSRLLAQDECIDALMFDRFYGTVGNMPVNDEGLTPEEILLPTASPTVNATIVPIHPEDCPVWAFHLGTPAGALDVGTMDVEQPLVLDGVFNTVFYQYAVSVTASDPIEDATIVPFDWSLTPDPITLLSSSQGISGQFESVYHNNAPSDALVATLYEPNAVRIQLLAINASTLGNVTTFDLVGEPTDAVAAHFNTAGVDADDFIDLAFVIPEQNKVFVLFNTGIDNDNNWTGFDVSDEGIVVLDVGAAPNALTAGDWNGDGAIDLAVSTTPTTRLLTFINDGTGQFAQGITIDSVHIADLTAGDPDGDLDLDLLAACDTTGQVRIFANDGTGAFSLDSLIPTPPNPRVIASAFLDAGPFEDFIVAHANGVVTGADDIITTYIVSGGAVSIGISRSVGEEPTDLEPSDIDEDKDVDVIVVSEAAGSINLFYNDGTGTLNDAGVMPVGPHPTSAALVDFDLDGDEDLAVATELVLGLDDDEAERAVRLLRNDTVSGAAPIFTQVQLLGLGQNP